MNNKKERYTAVTTGSWAISIRDNESLRTLTYWNKIRISEEQANKALKGYKGINPISVLESTLEWNISLTSLEENTGKIKKEYIYEEIPSEWIRIELWKKAITLFWNNWTMNVLQWIDYAITLKNLDEDFGLTKEFKSYFSEYLDKKWRVKKEYRKRNLFLLWKRWFFSWINVKAINADLS